MKQMRQNLKWLAILMMLWVPLILSCGLPQNEKNLKVETSAGKIKGKENDHARLFLGVPFAAPPVDELRWKAPQDPEPWKGVLKTQESQNVCVQSGVTTTWHPTGEIIGSEDCLYLDVYRPKTDEEDLPVYVYFHGGANRFGGAASYDGSFLAEDQNIIVVIPQYRLGPLGWLSHPALQTGEAGDEANDSGNFGTLDNIKALGWIQTNIANFGGDPANVTVGGQSAGGSNVGKLLISPLAAGLFKGAVIQSLGGSIFSPEAGEALAEDMLSNLDGYDQIVSDDSAAVEAFLRGKDAVELVAAHGTTYGGFSDGNVLPGGYVDVIYSNDYNAVPVLLGSTEYEFKNFMPLYGPSLGHSIWGAVYDLFDPDFDSTNEWTFDDIFPTQADIDLYEAVGKYRSLGWKYKAVDELAALMQNRQDNVYAFFFKWGGTESASAEFAHVFGAAHAMDIPFFFGYDHDLFGYALTDENRPGFEALQDVMMTYLGNFVRTGNPGEAGGVQWEEWSNDLAEDAPKCMILDADLTSARIGMDTEKVTLEGLQADAEAEVAGWASADAGLVMDMLAPYQAEYLFNNEAHELLVANLAFEPVADSDSSVDWGIHAQAGYALEVPYGWSEGESDLVMYAHGYRGDGTVLSVSVPSIRSHLIDNGFAWAASSYTANGYNILSGVESTADLLAYFKSKYGEPRRVYLIGHSMGGHITARTVADSEYKDDYVGAMPMCGVVGGASDLFNSHLDWGLTASYFSGLNTPVPYSATDFGVLSNAVFDPTGDDVGVLGEIPNYAPLSYDSFDGQLAVLTTEGELYKDAMMYRTGGERPMWDNAFAYWSRFMINNSAARLMDPTSGIGLGNIAGNMSTDYHLDSDGALNTTPEEAALDSDIVRIDDPIDAKLEVLMWPVSGNINIPVLTLHTLGDMYVPFSMEQLWAERIIDAKGEVGYDNLFRARAIRALGHCAFTTGEQTDAFDDLVAWVENGTIPDGDEILDPVVVAADDFGCDYTQYGRLNEDPTFYSTCTE